MLIYVDILGLLVPIVEDTSEFPLMDLRYCIISPHGWVTDTVGDKLAYSVNNKKLYNVNNKLSVIWVRFNHRFNKNLIIML